MWLLFESSEAASEDSWYLQRLYKEDKARRMEDQTVSCSTGNDALVLVAPGQTKASERTATTARLPKRVEVRGRLFHLRTACHQRTQDVTMHVRPRRFLMLATGGALHEHQVSDPTFDHGQSSAFLSAKPVFRPAYICRLLQNGKCPVQCFFSLSDSSVRSCNPPLTQSRKLCPKAFTTPHGFLAVDPNRALKSAHL